MDKDETQYVMVGKCPNCGVEFVRPPEIEVATCKCESVTAVPLRPALLLPAPMYNKCQRIADRANVTVDAFVDALLEIAIAEYEKIGFMEVIKVG